MNDLRRAIRSLRNRPLFAAVAIVTLALGIGATTTLFTIVNAVLLRPLPYPHADRIVSISEMANGKDGEVVADPDFFAWRRESRSFAALAMYGSDGAVLTGRGKPVRLTGGEASVGFFRVLGVQPALGRVFRPEEDVPHGPRVVILAHDLWQQRFGADSAVLGRAITLDGSPYTVIGVMPVGFAMPRHAEYWVPMQHDSIPNNRSMFFSFVIGRLKPGVSAAMARADLTAISARVTTRLKSYGPTTKPPVPVVLGLRTRAAGSAARPLELLLGAVGFLLLIACANVANLLLARAASRQREFAVRVALGASRWRLARQLLAESLVVSTIGGAVGLSIAIWSVGFFVRISPAAVSRVENIHVGWTVLGFCLAVSVVTGVLFGLIPAFAATRADLSHTLKESGTRSTGTAAQRFVRQSLVVAELATALVLLAGAGLLTRSFVRATDVNVGFDPDHLLTANVSLGFPRYRSDTLATAFFDRLAAQVRRLPGVEAVGYIDAPPLRGYMITMVMRLPHSQAMSPQISLAHVSGGFMTAEGADVVAGRAIDSRDRAGAPPAIVLSASASRILFPGQSAVGQHLSGPGLGGEDETVVGVVRDIQVPGSETPRLPQIYMAGAQAAMHPHVLAVRYAGESRPIEAAIRRIVPDMDPVDAHVSVSTMQSQLADTVAPRRFSSVVIDAFAALALVLAAVGLYGVMAYQVAQRTQELGIRMALGADRARTLRFVLREGMGLALLGTVCGIALSLGLTRLLSGMLYGVAPRDPATFTVVPVVLLLIALAATYLPARRATKVDPVVALRYE